MIIVQDSNTGGPSSITVRMEYLFVFGRAGQKVLFQFLFLVLLKEMRMWSESNPFSPLFSIFRNLPLSQKLWKKS